MTKPGNRPLKVSPTWMIVLACAAMLVGAYRVGGAQAPAAASASHACMDSSETRAIACSRETARRVGDTLFLKLGTGERRIVDTVRGGVVRLYRYAGRVGRAGFHIVTLHFYEGPWQTLLINPRSGREARVIMDLALSPEGERFVTAKPDWNDCQGDEPGMEVWRLTDSIPVLEWRLKPNSCATEAGWGAVEPRWRSADTLDFVRGHVVRSGESYSYARDPMAAVRDEHGWRLIGDRARPTENPPPIMPYVSEGECTGFSCVVKERIACRVFMAKALMPARNGTDVIPGDKLRVFGTVLVVDRPGVVVIDGPVSGGSGMEALPNQLQRGDTLYLLEYLGDARWAWWFNGRSGSSRLDWLDATGQVRPGMPASLRSEPLYTRWTKLMRMPRGPEGAGMTFVKAQPGMWATSRDLCPG